MSTEDDERRAAIAQAAAQLRDLAEYLRSERSRLVATGADTDLLDHVLAELDPIVVGAHDAEVAAAIGAALDRHGPGPWWDADLATVADVDLVDLRRIFDQMTAAGLISPAHDPPE